MTLTADLTTDARVRALIAAELERCGAALKSFERPRDVRAHRARTSPPRTGSSRPTLKLKRREVVARDGAVISELYTRNAGTAAAAAMTG